MFGQDWIYPASRPSHVYVQYLTVIPFRGRAFLI